MRIDICFSALILAAIASVCSAKPFKDLDFEKATVQPAQGAVTPSDAYMPISAAAALPGWTVKEDTTTCNAIWSYPGFDETSVSLNTGTGTVSKGAISGSFSLWLTSYPIFSGTEYYSTSSVSQTGDIPDDTRFIQFSLRPQTGITSAIPYVTISGQSIAVTKMSSNNGVETWTGDVSAFAGLTPQLTFAAIPDKTNVFFNASAEDNYILDDISFQVPEPTTMALLLLPIVTVFRRRRVHHLVARIRKGESVPVSPR